ncbi:fimbrial protein [Entomohabitans teleogrylli]|uniref:fimbrial protein n=1 Tax=Entomohabitans teleogrylli TaxID=1384589 RepID=UPI0008FC1E1F|nr:fimbrial protein [Entomohabitans teleogrylli]
MNFGDVVIQRDTPAGTVLARVEDASLDNIKENIIECDSAPKVMRYADSTYSTFVYNGITYFDIGVPGVGLRMSSKSGYWQAVWHGGALPVRLQGGVCVSSVLFYRYCGGSWGRGGLIFELVKTAEQSGSGPAKSGGTLIRASVENYLYAYTFTLAPGFINTVKCNVVTGDLNFSIGDVSVAEFNHHIGTVSVKNNTQSLVLDCDLAVNIHITLHGIQNPDVNDQSVLALTGRGRAGVADGIGVQLLYDGTPLQLNQRLRLRSDSPRGVVRFPITARYYQTKSTVVPGEANAVATLVITYQ